MKNGMITLRPIQFQPHGELIALEWDMLVNMYQWGFQHYSLPLYSFENGLFSWKHNIFVLLDQAITNIRSFF